jgi:hypothetical protein
MRRCAKRRRHLPTVLGYAPTRGRCPYSPRLPPPAKRCAPVGPDPALTDAATPSSQFVPFAVAQIDRNRRLAHRESSAAGEENRTYLSIRTQGLVRFRNASATGLAEPDLGTGRRHAQAISEARGEMEGGFLTGILSVEERLLEPIDSALGRELSDTACREGDMIATTSSSFITTRAANRGAPNGRCDTRTGSASDPAPIAARPIASCGFPANPHRARRCNACAL